jgi:hypothetical protein
MWPQLLSFMIQFLPNQPAACNIFRAMVDGFNHWEDLKPISIIERLKQPNSLMKPKYYTCMNLNQASK